MRAEEVENKLHTTADIAASASVDDVKSGCGEGGVYTKSELLIGTLLVLLLSNVNPVITECRAESQELTKSSLQVV